MKVPTLTLVSGLCVGAGLAFMLTSDVLEQSSKKVGAEKSIQTLVSNKKKSYALLAVGAGLWFLAGHYHINQK